jgi:hypothetical protein
MYFNRSLVCACAFCAGILLSISIDYQNKKLLHSEHHPVHLHGVMFTGSTSGSVTDTILEDRSYEVTQPQPVYVTQVTSLSW